MTAPGYGAARALPNPAPATCDRACRPRLHRPAHSRDSASSASSSTSARASGRSPWSSPRVEACGWWRRRSASPRVRPRCRLGGQGLLDHQHAVGRVRRREVGHAALSGEPAARSGRPGPGRWSSGARRGRRAEPVVAGSAPGAGASAGAAGGLGRGRPPAVRPGSGSRRCRPRCPGPPRRRLDRPARQPDRTRGAPPTGWRAVSRPCGGVTAVWAMLWARRMGVTASLLRRRGHVSLLVPASDSPQTGRVRPADPASSTWAASGCRRRRGSSRR